MKEPLTSRLLFPLTERRFTYDRYADWLARLDPRRVVPLRELAAAEPPVVGLRHDVDDRLDSAVTLARLEHARGIRASYFVLHTARYWRHDDRMLSTLRTIQDELGHEIGFHHDPVTLYAARVDIAAALSRELEWLRDGGLDVRGAAAHGSAAAHALRCHNNYFFRGWDEPLAGFDRTDVPKLDPSDLGLEYEAYHVPYDVYVSDSRFGDGRRTHPESFDPATLAPSERAVVLVHPCHWDRSPAAKTLRLAAKARRRGARLLSRR